MAQDKSDAPVSLAEAATSALSDVADQDGAATDVLDGMDYTKVKFLGMSYDSLETTPDIGTEMEFVVRGRVKGWGEDERKDGHRVKFVKVDVSSVVLRETT